MPAVRKRAGFNQLSFRRPRQHRAGDGPMAATAPALMALTRFVPIAAPGQIAKVTAIIAYHVNVRAVATGQFLHFASRIGHVAVVFLNQNVAALVRLLRARVLWMHIAPRRSLQDY